MYATKWLKIIRFFPFLTADEAKKKKNFVGREEKIVFNDQGLRVVKNFGLRNASHAALSP